MVFSMVAWIICWRRYLKLAKSVQNLVHPLPCLECLNKLGFLSNLSELILDGTRIGTPAVKPEEIRIFLCEDLRSAKFTIDGKNNWELAFAKGESLLKGLCTAGVDLTNLDETGRTILHVAVEQNNQSLVLLLLNLGFDMEVKDLKGRTALDSAKEANMTDMQDLLWGPHVGAERGEKGKKS